jgi:hypothetical protein
LAAVGLIPPAVLGFAPVLVPLARPGWWAARRQPSSVRAKCRSWRRGDLRLAHWD